MPSQILTVDGFCHYLDFIFHNVANPFSFSGDTLINSFSPVQCKNRYYLFVGVGSSAEMQKILFHLSYLVKITFMSTLSFSINHL